MNKFPFFSIITASYNSEKTIRETLNSVLNLDFHDYEYIVVDGGSTDGTVAIIEGFVLPFKNKGVPFTYVSEPDKGIYDAWNKGIRLSNGHWISFLGSDDTYLKDALHLYYTHIKNHPDSNYVCSQVNLVNDNNEIINVLGRPYVWEKVITDLDIAQVGSFHNRTLYEQIGLYSTEYKIVSDLDFFIRLKDIIKPTYFKKITAHMKNGGVSNQFYTALNEALRVKLKYGYTSKTKTYYMFYSTLLKCHINRFLNKK